MSLNGKWVPIDEELSTDIYEKLQADPEGVVVGDDGHIYCMAPREGEDEGYTVETVDLNTEDEVIHLKPVIQPLAIVPYVTTNQPLYQFYPPGSPQFAEQQAALQAEQQTQQTAPQDETQFWQPEEHTKVSNRRALKM